jgi:hypothetical protein
LHARAAAAAVPKSPVPVGRSATAIALPIAASAAIASGVASLAQRFPAVGGAAAAVDAPFSVWTAIRETWETTARIGGLLRVARPILDNSLRSIR